MVITNHEKYRSHSLTLPITSAVITTSSSNIIVSNEVCGYLRHIRSGTCVGVNEDKVLITKKEFCSDEGQHLFCQNTESKTMVRVTRNDPGSETRCQGKVYKSEDNYIKLQDTQIDDSATWSSLTRGNKLDQWRFKMSGEIRSENDRLECWHRSCSPAVPSAIVSGNCAVDENNTDDHESVELQVKQFGIQLYEETLGMQCLCIFLINMAIGPVA